jgi:hypothetical protein
MIIVKTPLSKKKIKSLIKDGVLKVGLYIELNDLMLAMLAGGPDMEPLNDLVQERIVKNGYYLSDIGYWIVGAKQGKDQHGPSMSGGYALIEVTCVPEEAGED